ncbi:MAG TPA: pentapeptide repeat-containing protein [Nostocaceae cyanobacterium]|nr:pentapeptide repeat-containing protein [Nostocaceae cyanobacterium]
MNNQSSLSISKPVKSWKKPLKADFKALFQVLGKCAVDGVTGNWGEAVKDVLEVTTAVGLETTSEEIAWLLIYRSLTSAIFSLLEDNKDLFSEKPIQSDIDFIIDKFSQTLENANLQIDDKFFIHPKKLSILPDIQNVLIDWLKYFINNQTKIEMISNRLPVYFVYELNKEWAKRSNQYANLREEIKTPFTQASDKEKAWQLYLSWLQKQVEEPMFLEAFGLKSVYVPLRAYYKRKIDNNKDDEFERRIREEETYQRIVIDLETELETWLNNQKHDDAIRVISGGPGSGKSSFGKIFAAKQAEKGEIPVLFIPLHHFQPSDDLVDAVGKFVRDDGFLLHNPLEAEPRLLIIFDGLDELAMQGKIASEIAKDFIREVQRKVERFNRHGETRLQVLISGRELVVQANSSDFRKPEQILHILPYFLEEYKRQYYKDDYQLLEHDQRNDWWKQYGLVSGLNYSALPSELNKNNLTEITAQPLLNYLVALSFVRGEVNFAQNNNLNKIYQDLLSAVYERGWDSYQHPSLQGIEEENFVRVLEEIALAAWHGDGRTTTVKDIENHCKNSSSRNFLNIFQEGAKLGLTRLLAAFYFRQSGANNQGDKTFEFTHKSFGEYLTARRIVRETKLIHRKLEARKNDPDEGCDEREALTRWVMLCGASPMDNYLFDFVVDEVGLQDKSEVENWQQTLCHLIGFMLRHGMPMERLNPRPDFQEENRQARNAEEALLVVLNACARFTEIVSNIEWYTPQTFSSWIARLHWQRIDTNFRLFWNCLSFLNLQGCSITLNDFSNATLEFSNLQGLGLDNINFQMAFLYGINLQKATLSHAYFEEAELDNANLEDANLRNADLNSASLQNANLRRAILENADLSFADLSEVDLQEANLEGADILCACIGGSNLEGATFEGANLTKVDLNGSNLKRANFRLANLEDADLEWTDLEGANLEGANLRGANLNDANLKNTILEGKDLTEITKKPDSDPDNQNTST